MTERIDVEQAADLLDVLGSANDPVWRHGQETTVAELAQSDLADRDARRILLVYSVGGGRWEHGSIASMLLDRLGVRIQ